MSKSKSTEIEIEKKIENEPTYTPIRLFQFGDTAKIAAGFVSAIGLEKEDILKTKHGLSSFFFYFDDQYVVPNDLVIARRTNKVTDTLVDPKNDIVKAGYKAIRIYMDCLKKDMKKSLGIEKQRKYYTYANELIANKTSLLTDLIAQYDDITDYITAVALGLCHRMFYKNKELDFKERETSHLEKCHKVAIKLCRGMLDELVREMELDYAVEPILKALE